MLLAGVGHAQAPADSLYGWMRAYVGRPAHDVVKDPLFDGLLNLIAPQRRVGLGQGPDFSFAAALRQEMGNSSRRVRLNDDRYLTLEGYRVDGGVAQTFLWVDLQADRALGALYANWNGVNQQIWIFSRREPSTNDPSRLPAEFFAELAAWQKAQRLPEFLPLYFLGSRGQSVLVHPFQDCSAQYPSDPDGFQRCAAGDRVAAEIDLDAALSANCRCSPLPPALQTDKDAWTAQRDASCAATTDPLCAARATHARAQALLAEPATGEPALRGPLPPANAGGERNSYVPPRAIYDPDPDYTDAARAAHIEGTISADVSIAADGTVTGVELVNTLGYGLDEQAIATLKLWRFQPATRGGTPVVAQARVRVSFHRWPRPR